MTAAARMELVLIAEELGRASFDVAMCFIGVLIPGLTVFRWATPRAEAMGPRRGDDRPAPARRGDLRAGQRIRRRRAAHDGR